MCVSDVGQLSRMRAAALLVAAILLTARASSPQDDMQANSLSRLDGSIFMRTEGTNVLPWVFRRLNLSQVNCDPLLKSVQSTTDIQYASSTSNIKKRFLRSLESSTDVGIVKKDVSNKTAVNFSASNSSLIRKDSNHYAAENMKKEKDIRQTSMRFYTNRSLEKELGSRKEVQGQSALQGRQNSSLQTPSPHKLWPFFKETKNETFLDRPRVPATSERARSRFHLYDALSKDGRIDSRTVGGTNKLFTHFIENSDNRVKDHKFLTHAGLQSNGSFIPRSSVFLNHVKELTENSSYESPLLASSQQVSGNTQNISENVNYHGNQINITAEKNALSHSTTDNKSIHNVSTLTEISSRLANKSTVNQTKTGEQNKNDTKSSGLHSTESPLSPRHDDAIKQIQNHTHDNASVHHLTGTGESVNPSKQDDHHQISAGQATTQDVGCQNLNHQGDFQQNSTEHNPQQSASQNITQQNSTQQSSSECNSTQSEKLNKSSSEVESTSQGTQSRMPIHTDNGTTEGFLQTTQKGRLLEKQNDTYPNMINPLLHSMENQLPGNQNSTQSIHTTSESTLDQNQTSLKVSTTAPFQMVQIPVRTINIPPIVIPPINIPGVCSVPEINIPGFRIPLSPQENEQAVRPDYNLTLNNKLVEVTNRAENGTKGGSNSTGQAAGKMLPAAPTLHALKVPQAQKFFEQRSSFPGNIFVKSKRGRPRHRTIVRRRPAKLVKLYKDMPYMPQFLDSYH